MILSHLFQPIYLNHVKYHDSVKFRLNLQNMCVIISFPYPRILYMSAQYWQVTNFRRFCESQIFNKILTIFELILENILFVGLLFYILLKFRWNLLWNENIHAATVFAWILGVLKILNQIKVQTCFNFHEVFKYCIGVAARNFCVSLTSLYFRHPNTGMKWFYTCSSIWAREWGWKRITQWKLHWALSCSQIKIHEIIFCSFEYRAK